MDGVGADAGGVGIAVAVAAPRGAGVDRGTDGRGPVAVLSGGTFTVAGSAHAAADGRVMTRRLGSGMPRDAARLYLEPPPAPRPTGTCSSAHAVAVARQDPVPGADAAAHCSPGGGVASSSCALSGRDEGPMRSCRTIRAVVCTTTRWGLRRITTLGIDQIHVLAASAGPTEHRRRRVGVVGRHHLPSDLWGVLVPGQIVGGEAGGEPPRLVIADRSQGGDILADQCPSPALLSRSGGPRSPPLGAAAAPR